MSSASTGRTGTSDGDRRVRPRGAYRADLRGFGGGRLRRMDQPRGDAAAGSTAPPDWDTPEAEVGLRVGGKIPVVMLRPHGRLGQVGVGAHSLSPRAVSNQAVKDD